MERWGWRGGGEAKVWPQVVLVNPATCVRGREEPGQCDQCCLRTGEEAVTSPLAPEVTFCGQQCLLQAVDR